MTNVTTAPAPKPASTRGDTRARLLTAAQELFVTKGFHATRPQDISRAAGVGHGTFYLHFKDKQACFNAFAEAAADALDTYVEENAVENLEPYDAIRKVISLTYEFSQAHPGLLAAALTDMSVIDGGDAGSMLMARWGVQWDERLAEWKSQGKIGAHVNTAYVGHAIPGIIRQIGEYAAGLDVSEDETLDATMAFLAAGLGLQRNGETA